jgi:hypothetical protein
MMVTSRERNLDGCHRCALPSTRSRLSCTRSSASAASRCQLRTERCKARISGSTGNLLASLTPIVRRRSPSAGCISFPHCWPRHANASPRVIVPYLPPWTQTAYDGAASDGIGRLGTLTAEILTICHAPVWCGRTRVVEQFRQGTEDRAAPGAGGPGRNETQPSFPRSGNPVATIPSLALDPRFRGDDDDKRGNR